MGLMKLSGDLYDYVEDSKLAASAPMMQDSITDNPAPEPQLPQIGKPAPEPTPITTQPQQVFTPTMGSELATTLPPMVRNQGVKMSRLRSLLNKQAQYEDFTEDDFSDMFETAIPTADSRDKKFTNMDYTPEPDYSNYLAYSPGTSQGYSYDMPEEQDLEAYNSMAYEPYSEQLSYDMPYEDYYTQQPQYTDQEIADAYASMGYSSPGSQYDAYYSMGAGAEPQSSDYYNMQVAEAPQPTPEQVQQQAYDESFNEIVQYLVQMGYSSDEAMAAAPSLLNQVQVTPPEPRTKVSSEIFHKVARELKNDYVQRGYSPTQAEEMSLRVVVPNKGAIEYRVKTSGAAPPPRNLNRLLMSAGGGAVLGGLGGGLAYDEDDEYGGALGGAVLGALLGARGAKHTDDYLHAVGQNNPNVSDARAKLLEALAIDAGTASIPAYLGHRAGTREGANNPVDKGFDFLSSVGDAVVDNPGTVAAAGAGAAGLYGLSRLMDLREEQPKQKGRTKKAFIIRGPARVARAAPVATAAALGGLTGLRYQLNKDDIEDVAPFTGLALGAGGNALAASMLRKRDPRLAAAVALAPGLLYGAKRLGTLGGDAGFLGTGLGRDNFSRDPRGFDRTEGGPLGGVDPENTVADLFFSGSEDPRNSSPKASKARSALGIPEGAVAPLATLGVLGTGVAGTLLAKHLMEDDEE